jgi:hypothetical protein
MQQQRQMLWLPGQRQRLQQGQAQQAVPSLR